MVCFIAFLERSRRDEQKDGLTVANERKMAKKINILTLLTIYLAPAKWPWRKNSGGEMYSGALPR